MTNGEGLLALLYAVKDIIEAGVVWVLTGTAMIIFFMIIVNFISNKFGLNLAKHFGASDSYNPKKSGNQILWALFILFIMFALYSLIGLTAAIFGVNSSPTGGMIVR